MYIWRGGVGVGGWGGGSLAHLQGEGEEGGPPKYVWRGGGGGGHVGDPLRILRGRGRGRSSHVYPMEELSWGGGSGVESGGSHASAGRGATASLCRCPPPLAWGGPLPVCGREGASDAYLHVGAR